MKPHLPHDVSHEYSPIAPLLLSHPSPAFSDNLPAYSDSPPSPLTTPTMTNIENKIRGKLKSLVGFFSYLNGVGIKSLELLEFEIFFFYNDFSIMFIFKRW